MDDVLESACLEPSFMLLGRLPALPLPINWFTNASKGTHAVYAPSMKLPGLRAKVSKLKQ